MESEIAALILRWIAQDFVIKKSELEKKWQALDPNTQENFQEIMKKLICQKDILTGERGESYYAIAPATLKKINSHEYNLIGHPHAEELLQKYGRIKWAGSRRKFVINDEIELIETQIQEWGIWLVQ